MANPNITAVTTITFQNGGWSLNDTGTGTAILLTVAEHYAIKINSLYVCNTQASDEVVTITFDSLAAGTGAAHNNDADADPSLISGMTIPANTTVQIIDNPIYLLEFDTMSGFGGTDDDDLKVFASWEVFNDA
tara:strand:+ start:62 stop:460 length:399 start_codon:yes stop_codon:yes gene_type:complete